jgi:phage terminase large subunit-like protein
MITIDQFKKLPPAQRVVVMMQLHNYQKLRNKIDNYYPDQDTVVDGVVTYHAREKYFKHLAFFAAGAKYRERAALCANRIGKTEGMGCYELARHLMGDYPDWWPGRRFNHPINAIAAGKTNEASRDILQAKLFGQIIHKPDGTRTVSGTGLIRGDRIGRITWKSGFADLIDRVRVKTNDGRWSELSMKSYEQGRKAFEGTERHVILLDEEPPFEIWTESLIRTATTGGMVIGTFTPLDGITETVKHFLPGAMMAKLQSDDPDDQDSIAVTGVVELAPSRCMIMAGWDDAPHLSAETKRELLDGTPAYQHKARSKGIPSLGDGAIFPIDEASIAIDPFPIPDHWPRIAALDFGWDHPTAVTWLVWDREADIVYVIDEYSKSRTVIPLHAAAINARGKWIPVAWPHDGYQVKDQTNGEQLAQQYRNEGVNMRSLNAQFEPTPGSKEQVSVVSVEAGLQEMLTRMSTGRWKVFKTCTQWFSEFRIYRRENGRVIKEFDDTISASRYGLMDIRYAVTPPVEQRRKASGQGTRHKWIL